MPFQLFVAKTKGQYEPTEFEDLENKGFWCSKTEIKEKAFALMTKEIKDFPWKIEVHPNKKTDKYHPDLICDSGFGAQIGEVKIKNSPLFFARKNYGIDPQYALTMDLKDSFNYRRWLNNGVDLQIFIWVKWEAHRMKTWGQNIESPRFYDVDPLKGIWMTKFSKLLAFEQKNSPPIHWYQERDRKPVLFDLDSLEAKEILNFDNRLQEGNKVKSLASKGFISDNGVLYPAGNSSASYVFDLMNKDLFEKIKAKQGYPY